MALPKTKFCSSVGMSVNGIQRTASSRSLTARFSRNRLVTVLIRRSCASVAMTSELPAIASTKMIAYRKIRVYPSSGKERRQRPPSPDVAFQQVPLSSVTGIGCNQLVDVTSNAVGSITDQTQRVSSGQITSVTGAEINKVRHPTPPESCRVGLLRH